MAVDLTAPHYAECSGLFCLIASYVARGFKYKNWQPHLASLISGFFAGLLIPMGIGLTLSPVFGTISDLRAVEIYYPMIGAIILWAAYESFRQAFKDG